MINSKIINGDGLVADVDNASGDETNGLIVATRNLKTYTPFTKFVNNPTYGQEMAQNAAFGSVVWTIHDGTDSAAADAGNCDGIGADTNKLEDTGQNFESTVVAGMSVHNTTDGTYSWITAVTDNEGLAVLDDIMDDGDDYVINPSWTFSEPVGTKWVEDNTAQFHNGSKSLYCTNPNIGDILQLQNVNGTDVTLAHCSAITMWIYVGSNWISTDSFSFYCHNDGAFIGNKVYLEDYFDFDNYGAWQFINIPLTDMGLTTETMDSVRIENEARGGAQSPTFWIDQIAFQTTGTSITYTLEPDAGTWLHVKAFQTTFVDAHAGTLSDGTMPNLAYNQILGMTPTVGYIYKRYAEGKSAPLNEARITNLFDLLSFPHSKITNHISDGTNTLITITDEYLDNIQYTLKSETADKITFTIEDKFDDLLNFRIAITGFVEQR